MPGHTGIGHTRWATHGGVTYKNAHPHYGCTDKIAIVHNGIIENYKELREELIFLDHTFISDTDSEVIAHLLERYYSGQKNIKKTVIETCRRLKGTYAFVAAFEDGTICGSRYDEPLIIGSVNNGYFISSDVLGFLEYTDKAIFLDNRDIVIVDSETCHIFDLDGNTVNREITKVAWELAAIDKGKYAHHTLKEIHEQPNIVQKAGTQNLEKIEEFCNIVMRSKALFLVGSGTSYHSALIAKHILSKFAKIRAEAIISSEFQYTFDDIDKTSAIIAISQSGETADVLQSVKAAKQMGARILSIVNNPTSSLARISDSSLSIDCGPEIGVAATKSFTAQLSLIYTIVDRLCNGCLDFEANKAFLVGALRQVLDTEIQIRSIAEGLRDARDIYIIGEIYPLCYRARRRVKNKRTGLCPYRRHCSWRIETWPTSIN